MNTKQKAIQYTVDHPKSAFDPLTWDDVREAYVQGSKDMYIEKEHEKIYNASEYLPKQEPDSQYSATVLDEYNNEVSYDHRNEFWVTNYGVKIDALEKWRYPEPSKTQNKKPWAQKLWEHMSDEHGLTLLDSELIDIVHLVREIDKEEKPAHQLQEELKQAQYEIEEMKNVIKHLNGFRFKANEEHDQLKETFEELLTSQFSLCESRDVWRKRAGLVQKCEE